MISQIIKFALARGMPAAINFFAIVYFTHKLGAEGFGKYSLSMTYIGLSSVPLFMWIRAVVVRFYVSSECSRGYVRHVAWLSYLAILTIICIALFLSYILGISTAYIGILMICVCSSALFEIIVEFIRLDEKINIYALVNILRSIFFILISVIFLNYESMYSSVLLAYALSYVFTSVLSVIFSKLYKHKYIKESNNISFKYLISYGFPVAVASWLSMIIMSTDKIVINYLNGDELTGMYSASADLSIQAMSFILSCLGLVFFPILLKKFESDKNVIEHSALYISVISYGLTSVLFCLVFFSRVISYLIFPSEYHDVTNSIMPFIAVSSFLFGIKSNYFDYAFFFAKKSANLFYLQLFMVLINVPLTYFFVRYFGVMGAAYSTVILAVLGVAISVFFGRKYCILTIYDKRLTNCFMLNVIVAYSISVMCNDIYGMMIYVGISITISFVMLMSDYRLNIVR
ncbi:polysaccharide biosynthesis protein [Vibrio ichthyoenteri ATCC 700023]|uniref:Polysaccharide biosynthesis protein n=1 Tax=Vibrio ichthyoenteri ATCC 700023 TaxID=870968 RepID=F9S4N4_9VIBR|nr:oligosaccharide flippase family protein [Vibrio ichthyoenteri]EGU36724.1 polysaccharide biosynthesis protein [Vibrio ichthyoenteri ATCC 700023]